MYSEPTSVTKSTRILPGIAAAMRKTSDDIAPVAFASPNLLELAHMYNAATSLELTAHEKWWHDIDTMSLGSHFRLQLEQLARRDACEHSSSKGTLSFLLDNGVAQMAVNLLPFFQHLVLKAGDKGLFTIFRLSPTAAQRSGWAYEQTNVRARQVLARGRDGGLVVLKHYPAILLAPDEVVNVTGAGDTLVGSTLASLVQNPLAFEDPQALDQLAHRAQTVCLICAFDSSSHSFMLYSRLQR